MREISINIGHVTNSSSVVHFFDKRLLEDPDVAAFIKAYDLGHGHVGHEMWIRDQCDSVLITKEQKELAAEKLQEEHVPGWDLPTDDDSEIGVIYGDEYDTPAAILCNLLLDAQERLGIPDRFHEYFN